MRSERRREDLRRNVPRPTRDLFFFLSRPEIASALALTTAFIIITGLLVVWSREEITPPIGQIMNESRFNRVTFNYVDATLTAQAREEARRNAPRIYRLNNAYLDRLSASLRGLPRALAGKTSLSDIAPEIVEEFRLTESGLQSIAAYANESGVDPRWNAWVNELINWFSRVPVLGSLEYQTYQRTFNRAMIRDDTSPPERLDSQVLEMLPGNRDHLESQLIPVLGTLGFPAPVIPYVAAGLVHAPADTHLFDAAATIAAAEQLAAAVQPVAIEHRLGESIYRRGDRLTAGQLQDLLLEREEFRTRSSFGERWLPRIGLTGLIAILVGFVGGFVLISYPRILRNPLRLMSLFSLQAGMLATTALTSVTVPQLAHPAAIAPTLLVAIITMLAYDRRLALFVSTVQCALVALALDRGVGSFTMLIAGCGTMILQLSNVRERNTLIRASLVTGLVLAVASILLGFFRTPLVDGLFTQILGQAIAGFGSAVLLGFLVLGILPSIERLFDITTGMTLAELRDTSRPLLRQLQQRAPGTYNHSLMVAAVAEAGADAIGADSHLLYVGALYHDIGKMNKPEYFVENQSDGFNRHTRLRPAMSLLVIIGHVKDGMELAREYRLPRSIQHFIEAHHGTTLVEYFYNAAVEQAEADQKKAVDEIEFRYPGPKPRTKEAAILMLADCVESATRAISEPSPARIDAIVRELSRKRLLDDQFSECDLTFRELRLIEDAMIQRLVAVHHSRISYARGSRTSPAGSDAPGVATEPSADPAEPRRSRA